MCTYIICMCTYIICMCTYNIYIYIYIYIYIKNIYLSNKVNTIDKLKEQYISGKQLYID